MHKRHLHHILVLIRKVRLFYLVILIAVGAGVSILALRHNNLRAIELREVVIQADKQNGDVETPLRQLREFTYGHMHSGLAAPDPPVQLKYHYERLVAAEEAKVKSANAELYTAAQRQCEAQIPSGRSLGRIECIQAYVTARGVAPAKSIPDDLYKFDFAAPLWSPDLAGWSIVMTTLLVIVLLVRVSAVAWIKHTLKEYA